MTPMLHPPSRRADLHRWKDVVRVAARHGIAPNAPLEDEIARRGLSLAVTRVLDPMGGWSYQAVLRRPDGRVVAEGRAPLRGSDGRFARDNRRMAVLRALAAYLVASDSSASGGTVGRTTDAVALPLGPPSGEMF